MLKNHVYVSVSHIVIICDSRISQTLQKWSCIQCIFILFFFSKNVFSIRLHFCGHASHSFALILIWILQSFTDSRFPNKRISFFNKYNIISVCVCVKPKTFLLYENQHVTQRFFLLFFLSLRMLLGKMLKNFSSIQNYCIIPNRLRDSIFNNDCSALSTTIAWNTFANEKNSSDARKCEREKKREMCDSFVNKVKVCLYKWLQSV